MEKYDFIKCMNLHKKLKDRIKGHIFISLQSGVFYININAGRGINYKINISDLSSNFNIERLVDEIEYDYRKFISNRFFIN